MTNDFADQLFAAGVRQAQAARDRITQSAHLRNVQTPIVRDMRMTARELGIVELLLQHQRIVYHQPSKAYDLVEDALLRLGVDNGELLKNLRAEGA